MDGASGLFERGKENLLDADLGLGQIFRKRFWAQKLYRPFVTAGVKRGHE